MPQTHMVSIKPVINALVWVTRGLYRLESRLAAIPYFWHRVRLTPEAPRHHRWTTVEYEWPNREAEAHVVRLVGWLGIAFGRWNPEPLEEVVAAARAVQASELDQIEPNSFGVRAEHLADWTIYEMGEGQ